MPFCVPITLQAYLQASDISLTITCFQVELCTSSRNSVTVLLKDLSLKDDLWVICGG